jgi:hypothetical protein
MEVWTRKNPSLHHLRRFECEAYAHVPKKKQLKLDSKVVKFIFINYGVDFKGYNI